MKANELRIGNYTINENGGVVEMYSTRIRIFSDGTINYKPIPLTEEWLLKFGFEESENCYELEINGSISIFFAGYLGVMIDGVFSFLDKDQFYVHQLQNLYFALTNEELTLKQD